MPRISNTDACTLIQQYRDSGGWANGQTKSIWFSAANLEELQQLISESNGDGVHVYLAKYPSAEMAGAPAKSKNRLTVVFVPTANGQDIFNVEAVAEAHTAMKAMTDGTGGTGGDSGYNHGTLEP
ncbi:MAG TPA: hypothetical protein VGI82_10950 [Chitinophagaceae bacterium]|jgi:hypothetical protein